MSKIQNLLDNYDTHIAIPWRDVAAAQRVIFCVYPESHELKLRAKIEEFEIATKNHKHDWIKFNLTDTFAKWVCDLKYAKSYYQKPQLMASTIQRYLDYIEEELMKLLKEKHASGEHVVALYGVGSVFGFLKVRDLVDRLSPKVDGRLVIFFPGSYENNNYRLLDGYDGWNYHAFVVTCDREI